MNQINCHPRLNLGSNNTLKAQSHFDPQDLPYKKSTTGLPTRTSAYFRLKGQNNILKNLKSKKTQMEFIKQ